MCTHLKKMFAVSIVFFFKSSCLISDYLLSNVEHENCFAIQVVCIQISSFVNKHKMVNLFKIILMFPLSSLEWWLYNLLSRLPGFTLDYLWTRKSISNVFAFISVYFVNNKYLTCNEFKVVAFIIICSIE